MTDSGADDSARYFENVENDGGATFETTDSRAGGRGVKWVRLILVIFMGKSTRDGKVKKEEEKGMRRVAHIAGCAPDGGRVKIWPL